MNFHDNPMFLFSLLNMIRRAGEKASLKHVHALMALPSDLNHRLTTSRVYMQWLEHEAQLWTPRYVMTPNGLEYA